MRLARIAWAILPLVVLLSSRTIAQDITTGDPESLGFSTSRLARIASWYEAKIDAGALPGAVVAIARNGKLAYQQAIGFQDRDKKIPLKSDSLFWIASMTKPVTSVAAMMLVEQGKLDLAAPVSQYLPELKDLLVGVEKTDTTGKAGLVLERQTRPMTVRDLLSHTSGLVHPKQGNTAVHRLNSQRTARSDQTLAEFVTSIAKLPLAHQPGEIWEYSDWGLDVLARIVEVASGEPFDQFLETSIFKPLHMVDTGFYVPEAKLSRLVDPAPEGRDPLFDVTSPRRYFSGAGGLVSTAPDYLRFCQMLLNGGELDGVRILAPATVAQMITNSLPANTGFAGNGSSLMGPEHGTSWGLGFAIRADPEFSWVPGAVGSFSWSGAWGTYFWIDPSEKLIGVQMVQVARQENQGYFDAIRHLVYAALKASVAESTVPTPSSVNVGSDTLSAYVGKYYFGPSLSPSDRQSLDRSVFGGIGLVITNHDGAFKAAPIEGKPAARAGVMSGDIITHVDALPIAGLRLDQIISKVRGPINTETMLTLARTGREGPMTVTIKREAITLPGAEIDVKLQDEKLLVEATGAWPVFEMEKNRAIALRAMSSTEFYVDGGDHTRLAFVKDQAGKISGAALNPGPSAIEGVKIN
jgi:CubicO group peptidase (beta-lactamase class C family)